MSITASETGTESMPRRQQYEQVAADLRARITSGEYPAGSQLPSRAELCEIYQVSDTVTNRAMWMLRMEGLTETLPGVGVFVRGSH